MHELLSRQIALFLDGDTEPIPPELLAAIDLAYHQADIDRGHLRRSMEATSRELLQRNDELRLEVEERTRASDELVRRSRRQALEVDLGVVLTRSGDLPETARGVVQTLDAHLKPALSALWALDEENDLLELLAHAGPVESFDQHLVSIALGQDPVGSVARTGEARSLEGAPEIFAEPVRSWLEKEGIVSFVGQPLIVETRVVGVMAVFLRRPVSEPVPSALAAVSSGVALALERQRAEADYRASQTRLRDIIEHSSNLFYVQEPGGQLTYLSPQSRDFLDCEPHEAQRPLESFATDHPANPRGLERHHRAATEGKRQPLYELELIGLQGRKIWVEVNEAPVVRGGLTVAMVGALTDITERKRAELEREESLSLLRATLEATAEGIVVTDIQGRVCNFNRRFTEMWAVELALPEDSEDPCGPSLVEVLVGQVARRQAFLELMDRLTSDPELEVAEEIRLMDSRSFQLTSMPQRLGGHSVGRVSSFRDITEARRLEQQMRQAQKMEAVGRLAGGIAHDFNNLLTVIKGYCSLMQHELREHQHLEPSVVEIGRAADRAADLTSQLLAFSRQQVMEPRLLDLNDSVADLRKMLGRVLGEDIELVLELEAKPATVLADAGQLQQVLLNLVINARDALPAGGSIQVSTRSFDVNASFARQFDYPVALGPSVLLEVRDTGMGMDEETQGRIFEPFFTTKDVGRGTGLGLSTVYGIIKQTGGYIWVDSEPGEGTLMTICLPQAEGAAIKETSSTPKSMAVGGGETVLVVEDDLSVRTVLSRVLDQHGFRVFVAGSPQEALERFPPPEQSLLPDSAKEAVASVDSRVEPIDLLITDIVLPGMDGYELVERLLVGRPDTRVLYISGYSPETYERKGRLRSAAAFLQKPFDTPSLVAKVREVLDGEAKKAAAQPAELVDLPD